MFDSIVDGFWLLLSLQNLLAILAGLLIGVIVGAIPGLTATMATAVAVPLTYTMSPVTALAFLMGIYKGGIYGGSIPAILLNIPGTPAASCTVLDGYPMAKKGKGGIALLVALYASVIGDTFSDIVLMLVAPPIAALALRFGPAEQFALMVFSLSIIGMVSGRTVLKGLIAGIMGLLLATPGIDPVTGVTRFTFGISQLAGGLSLIPVLIGLFGMAEILTQVENRDLTISKVPFKKMDWKLSRSHWKAILPPIARGSIFGTIIGAIPGLGQSPAAFLTYSETKRVSKDPDKFGKGCIEGVAAAEAGNNAVDGATLIPLLTLGIPGDVVTGVILGALLLQGLTPGPLLFQQHPSTMYAIFLALIIANIGLLIVGRLGIKYFARVTTLPLPTLMPILAILCAVGAYSINRNPFDIGVMFVFGFIGYLMRKYTIPQAPLAIGFILGPILEKNMRRAFLLGGGPGVLLHKPIALVFFALTILIIIFMIRQNRKRREFLSKTPSADV